MRPRAPAPRLRDGGFQLDIHQAFDFHGIQIATDHHAQVIGDELHDVMVAHQIRILGKIGLASGSRCRPQSTSGLSTNLGQNFEEHCQGIDVKGLVEFRALEHPGDRPTVALMTVMLLAATK
jgi:hypothetical protein